MSTCVHKIVATFQLYLLKCFQVILLNQKQLITWNY